MSLFRALFLLAIFFVGLYFLREPVSNVGPNLHKIVVEPTKTFLNNLKGATSTIKDYNPLPNYGGVDVYPSTGTSTSTTTKPTTPVSKPKQLAPVTSKINSATDTNIKTDLTSEGIIEFTNRERVRNGKKPLTANGFLSKSAAAKLQDMFEQQYFEHISPNGEGVDDVVTEAGYRYIVVGENLALGFFGGDSGVVSAWMESPGHRANMLDGRFSEIGVAVALGSYKGKRQWIAVQHFGKPLSACIYPSADEKKAIEQIRLELHAEQETINTMGQDIERFPQNNTPEKVDTYNARAAAYNTKVNNLKIRVDAYNAAVKGFNACVGL